MSVAEAHPAPGEDGAGAIVTRHDFAALAERHRTPLYLYDLDAAVAHARQLRARLPERLDLLYCVKANPCRRVVAAFHGVVDGLDLSSAGELRLAQQAGFSPTVMSLAGPGKSDQELAAAIGAGVGWLSVESHGELRRADAIARSLGRVQPITLRLNPLAVPREFPMKMGGQASQFGIPEEEADQAIAAARAAAGLRLGGLHVFSGTNCLEAPAIVENIRGTLALAAGLARRHDLALEVINLGGGFGIPYFPGQQPLAGEALAAAVSEAITGVFAAEPRFAATRLVLELGRYLIGAFGVYLARVVDVKDARGKRFVVLDGGMNHCFPATGNFGQLIKKNYPLRNLTRPGAERVVQEIVGPLCTPIDSLARAIESPRAEVGDLIAFESCGAYSFTASPVLFLGHDLPAEIVFAAGVYEVARERRAAELL